MTDLSMAELRGDGDAQIDYLLDREFLTTTDDGGIAVTESFEDVRGIYVDSYKDVDDETVHETVAELFGVSVEEATDYVTENDLSRWELATYLTLKSELEEDLPQDIIVELAAIVAATDGPSPVPSEIQTLPEEFQSFLDSDGKAVVFVFARQCAPCRKLKSELDDILAAVPDGVVVAGADGENVPDLRRAHEIDVAPTILLFTGGSVERKFEGYTSPEDLHEAFETVF